MILVELRSGAAGYLYCLLLTKVHTTQTFHAFAPYLRHLAVAFAVALRRRIFWQENKADITRRTYAFANATPYALVGIDMWQQQRPCTLFN